MVTAEDVRRLALSLPRTSEGLVRDRVKFRVGRIVFAAISPDEQLMGFGFPKEERAALVASEPEKFLMPRRSDERYNWVRVRLDAIDQAELRELIIDAWRMCVPKKVAAEYAALTQAQAHPEAPAPGHQAARSPARYAAPAPAHPDSRS